LAARRVHLYETHSAAIGGVIPAAQPPTATVAFGEIGYAPVGARETEYLTLVNEGDAAVDLSGWRLAGGVEHTFQPGVVIPAGGTLYLSPDTVAFRARATSPTGGEGRFVQGPYAGQLSDRGGLVRLYNASGALVAHRFFLDVGPVEGGLTVAGIVLMPLAVVVRRLHHALRQRARRARSSRL
jgi:hypothetical protein